MRHLTLCYFIQWLLTVVIGQGHIEPGKFQIEVATTFDHFAGLLGASLFDRITYFHVSSNEAANQVTYMVIYENVPGW